MSSSAGVAASQYLPVRDVTCGRIVASGQSRWINPPLPTAEPISEYIKAMTFFVMVRLVREAGTLGVASTR
jgi:hypothetical protein